MILRTSETCWTLLLFEGKSIYNDCECLRDMLDTLTDVHNEEDINKLGGVHQLVDEHIFCHVVHHFGLVFGGKSI